MNCVGRKYFLFICILQIARSIQGDELPNAVQIQAQVSNDNSTVKGETIEIDEASTVQLNLDENNSNDGGETVTTSPDQSQSQSHNEPETTSIINASTLETTTTKITTEEPISDGETVTTSPDQSQSHNEPETTSIINASTLETTTTKITTEEPISDGETVTTSPDQSESDSEAETTTIISTSTLEPTTITTEEPANNEPISCTLIGETKAKENDCQSYYICAWEDDALQMIEHQCGLGTVYNAQLRRCARDLSACTNEGPDCVMTGTFPDGTSNTSYIWCVPSLTNIGKWHKFRVNCAPYETYRPVFGSCFFDIDKAQYLKPSYYQPNDLDIIKAEIQELKTLEKLQLKEEKLKLKMEKKLQKEMLKKAIKDAKERAKLEGKDSAEIDSLTCVQEGNFPSPLGPNFYINCVSKKGKFKPTTLVCPLGQNFDLASGICI